MAHEDVLEAAVIGIAHPKWEERPLALVVLHKWVETDPDQIKAGLYNLLEGRFAKWQFPDEILFVEEIPKTSVGKFYKKEMRASYGQFYMA